MAGDALACYIESFMLMATYHVKRNAQDQQFIKKRETPVSVVGDSKVLSKVRSAIIMLSHELYDKSAYSHLLQHFCRELVPFLAQYCTIVCPLDKKTRDHYNFKALNASMMPPFCRGDCRAAE